MDCIIPYDERDKLDEVLDVMDHPVYVDRGDISTFFDKLNMVFWKAIDTHQIKCSFCYDIAEFFNKPINMHACSSCIQDLENKEIDVINPEDHALSNKLRSIICQWIDMNHYCCCNSVEFFEEYNIIYNTCHICNEVIENNSEDDVAIATNARAIAHYKCAEAIGFRNHFTEEDYDGIISSIHIDDYIEVLIETPSYVPEIAILDKQYLNQIMNDEKFVNTINYKEIFELFGNLHPKQWNIIDIQQGCKFCYSPCRYYNPILELFSCHQCLSFIESGNINISFDPIH